MPLEKKKADPRKQTFTSSSKQMIRLKKIFCQHIVQNEYSY